MHNYRLETKRLIIRQPVLDDAPSIQTYVSDWELAKTTLNIPHPYPEDGALTWLRGQFESPQDHTYNFVICLKDTSLIGSINAVTAPRHHRAEIGYWIGKPFWGQGYATEAARRIVELCFEELDLNRVYATYFAGNPASRRVMEKAGMTYEGMMKQHAFRWSRYIDMGICGITREEWESQNPPRK